MKILIAYGTTDGQTQKIARFCTDQLIDSGHSVELLNVTEAGPINMSRFVAVVVAGSIHTGKFQSSLIGFVIENLPQLKQCDTLFISVSLSAAGEDTSDWAGLRRCIENFTKATNWTPKRVEHVAGAFRFTSYDFFRHWAMRWVASVRDETIDPAADKEYTDWSKLEDMLREWCDSLNSPEALS